jgi:hypothetical protein
MVEKDAKEEASVVHHHYYLPMPIFETWLKSQRGNYAMVKFNKTVPQELLDKAFTSPATGDKTDPELVAQFKTMGLREALLIPLDTSITERSLKVQVGKAAKAAGRTLEWGKVDEGYVVRVKLISNGEASANGQVTEEVTTEEVAEEAPASGRNRR